MCWGVIKHSFIHSFIQNSDVKQLNHKNVLKDSRNDNFYEVYQAVIPIKISKLLVSVALICLVLYLRNNFFIKFVLYCIVLSHCVFCFTFVYLL